jgi:MFS family permease
LRFALGAVAIALAAVVFDAAAVPVLLPAARLSLGSSSSGVQWAQNAYLLGIAALLPPLASLARTAGGRTLAVCGAVALAGGAAVCANADTTSALVAGRAVEGAGAAALLGALAAVRVGEIRPAVAVLPALALVVGPLVGGGLAQHGWWRVFFWAEIPLAAVAAAPLLLAPHAERTPPGRELPGLLALAALLTALTIGLVQGEPWGLGWAGLCVLVAAALALRLVTPWGRALTPAAAIWLALAAVLATLGFLVPQYLELARGLSALRAGVLLMVVILPAIAGWALAWRSSGRLELGTLLAAGIGAAAVGLAVLGTLDAQTRYALIGLALALAGGGVGLAAGALCGARLGEPPGRLLAAAAVGAALGLAAAGATFQQAQAEERASSASFEQALARGVGAAALLLVALLVATAPEVWRLTRSASGAHRAVES